MDDRRNHNYVQ